MKELLNRINELAAISKERKLTPEEFEERTRLRKAYLEQFRTGFKETLLHTKVVDKEGRDVTPIKLREAQEEMKEEALEEAREALEEERRELEVEREELEEERQALENEREELEEELEELEEGDEA